MSGDRIRTVLNDLEASDSMVGDALRAVLDVNREHRETLTGRGRYPERINECHCLGCDSVRAIATALGIGADDV